MTKQQKQDIEQIFYELNMDYVDCIECGLDTDMEIAKIVNAKRILGRIFGGELIETIDDEQFKKAKLVYKYC